MAVVLLCSSGTSAAGADILREVLPVGVITPLRAAIPGVAVFHLPPVGALQAEVFPAVGVRLAAPLAEAVLAAVPALTVVAGSEDKEKI